MSKAVQFQTIQISISTQFKCKYSLIVKKISNSAKYKYRFCLHTVNSQNISMLNNSV